LHPADDDFDRSPANRLRKVRKGTFPADEAKRVDVLTLHSFAKVLCETPAFDMEDYAYTKARHCHTRVDVVAHCHGNPVLRIVAQHKMRQPLILFEVHTYSYDDVTELVQYSSTKKPHKREQADALGK
jgi:hypothetical protein